MVKSMWVRLMPPLTVPVSAVFPDESNAVALPLALRPVDLNCTVEPLLIFSPLAVP
jgi:hypothetical protein